MTKEDVATSFLTELQLEATTFNKLVSTSDGDWVVKGFIDIFRNVYTISADTKVVSKLIELRTYARAILTDGDFSCSIKYSDNCPNLI